MPAIAHWELTSSLKVCSEQHQESVFKIQSPTDTSDGRQESQLSKTKEDLITYPTAQEQATPVNRSQNHQLPEKELKQKDKGKDAMVRSGNLLRILNSGNLTWKKSCRTPLFLILLMGISFWTSHATTSQPRLQGVVKCTSLYCEKQNWMLPAFWYYR